MLKVFKPLCIVCVASECMRGLVSPTAGCDVNNTRWMYYDTWESHVPLCSPTPSFLTKNTMRESEDYALC